MEYSPPPLFKQGAPALAKVVFFALIAIILLVADSRMRSLALIRQLVGTALYPLQMVAVMPRDAAYKVGEYFASQSSLEAEVKKLKRQQVANALILQQAQQLNTENLHLRKLLEVRERMPVKSVLSEILYDARDAFTRKIVMDHGTRDGVALGQPVIDDVGVVGQVTRVFMFTSEVTLLTDKDQAIPVQVVRNGLRSVAYGRGQAGGLDLRFMAANADIKVGDVLVTSGIDGVYPPGLAVAKVQQVDNNANGAFGRVVCQPLAGIDRNRQLLILLADLHIAPRPEPEASDKPGKKRSSAKANGNDAAAPSGAKDAAAEAAKPVQNDAVKPAPKLKETTQ